MHADNFVVNYSCARKAVEGVAKSLPKLDTEATTAFIVESVYPVDPRALVIATENEEVLRILDLISKQQTHNFQRLLSSVNVVSKKEVVGLH
jgi:hypothetical protein